jgi:hypothetical protein
VVTGRYSQLAGRVETYLVALHRLGDSPLLVSDQADTGIAVDISALTDLLRTVMAISDETRSASDLPASELPI